MTTQAVNKAHHMVFQANEILSDGICRPGTTVVVHYFNWLSKRKTMLSYAVLFLIIAIIAAALGFSGVAGTASWIAQVLFLVFLVLFIVSLFRRGPR